MKTATIYGSDQCPACTQTKKFLFHYNIQIIDKNVSIQKNAEECVEISKQMNIPVTVIGETIIIGFDEKKLKKAIEK